MTIKKYKICKSCGGPVKDYPDKKVLNPEFCPYCVDEQGDLLGYRQIVESMILYIKNDHPEIKPKDRHSKAETMLKETEIWGERFTGVIIKESLKSDNVLNYVKIVKEEVSKDNNPETNGGYPTWHLLYVEFFRPQLEDVLGCLKKDLKGKDWYADFKGRKDHHIIFCGRVFRCILGKRDSYKKAIQYGLKVGVPTEQLDFV
ncbi:hypothetical protein JW766_03305 [Candidatus Dojkabacteria bacterium]|nr:hypothetical protein [Candidatus Dojkabacteria bacterium]